MGYNKGKSSVAIDFEGSLKGYFQGSFKGLWSGLTCCCPNVYGSFYVVFIRPLSVDGFGGFRRISGVLILLSDEGKITLA